MAEGTIPDPPARGNWWGTWLEAAKEKSTSVLEFMKRDLNEFSQAVQQETSLVVQSTAATLRDKLNIDITSEETTAGRMTRSVSSLLTSVSSAFTPLTPDNEDQEAIVIRNSQPVILDRLQLQLLLAQRDPATYLDEPQDPEYEDWLRGFDLDSRQTELSELMVTNIDVRNNYTRLVPTCTSHVVFWHRYFFKVHQITEAERRRQELKRRAERTTEEIQWDEDDEMSQTAVSDIQADQVLKEYEKECVQRDEQADDESTTLTKPSSQPPNETENERASSKASSAITPSDGAGSDMVVIEKDKSPDGSSSKGSSIGEEWVKDLELETSESDAVKLNRKPGNSSKATSGATVSE